MTDPAAAPFLEVERPLAAIRADLAKLERIPATGFRADVIRLLAENERLAARLPALEAENRTLRASLAAYRSHTCDTYGARGQCSRCAPLSIEDTING